VPQLFVHESRDLPKCDGQETLGRLDCVVALRTGLGVGWGRGGLVLMPLIEDGQRRDGGDSGGGGGDTGVGQV
jgi:hypothetical protein